MKDDQLPSEYVVRKIIEDVVGGQIVSIDRFTTGKDNYVFDVKTETDNLVVRLNTPDRKSTFRGAYYWYNVLKPMGLPLPTIRYQDVEGLKYGFLVIVMDRLPGKDLMDVYVELTSSQKEILATEIVEIQQRVSALELGRGFGYATRHDDTWGDEPLYGKNR